MAHVSRNIWSILQKYCKRNSVEQCIKFSSLAMSCRKDIWTGYSHCRKNEHVCVNTNNNNFLGSARLTSSRSVSALAGRDKDYIYRQLMDYKSFTYTYLLADPETRDAILIDPVLEMVHRDIKLVEDMKLHLKYVVNTHVHADHITGSGMIKGRIQGCKSMISEVSTAHADIKLREGDKIVFGRYELEVRSTPGHTNGCLTFVWHDKGMAFTGDAILIRGCGRTDFQEGSSSTLYESVHNKILSLPSHYTLLPAHDYTGQTSTTVEEEKTLNPRLTKTKEQFIKIMEDLKLPYPKQIDRALPANMVCGLQDVKS